MSEVGDGLGTAVEGGLFARAIDPRSATVGTHADTVADGHFAESLCLNCGTALMGPHCHRCGQQAHLHRTLGAFLHDLLHGVLHFEGRTWATLPMLVARPGELTRRYIAGERARFVSPMALFLFTVFLMFAVFQAVGLTLPTDFNTSDQVKASIGQFREDTTERRDALQAELAAMAPTDPDREDTQARLRDASETLDGLARIEPRIENGDGMVQTGIDTGIPFLDHAIEKWNRNPGLMLYKLQANGYKFSWLLIPISVPFVWLLFAWKPGFGAYDHAIFVTYSIAFMSLLFIVLSLMAKAGTAEWVWSTLFALVPPIHLYKHLRGAYGLSRFSAGWRLGCLLVFITMIAGLFLNLLLVIGAF